MQQYNIDGLNIGQKLKGVVTNITPYGAFVNLENGAVGMIHIEDFSIARIKSPKERVKIGQNVNIMIKSIDEEKGRINLSYKESFGTWEENAQKFKDGMTTKGIIRETEKNKNGIFVELTPNLVGMIEYQEGFNYGEQLDVIVKKIDYQKKKVKLTVV